MQLVLVEATEDGIRRAGLFARWIEILHADQPATFMHSRMQVTYQRTDQ